jgi:surfeit locus 1 family protein
MAIRVQLGSRVFAPSWLFTMLTAILCVLFVSLGRWQWNRGVEKQVVWDSFARGTDALVALGNRRTADMPRYAQVSVTGRYAGERQFLLDNRTLDGKAGYEVLTPFALADGRWLLVNRGWVPFTGFRDRLPDVALPDTAERSIQGRVDRLPSAGLASGRAAPASGGTWPRVTTYPAMAELESALGGTALEAQVLLLDANEPLGFELRWRPPGMEPVKHTSYAIQWWSFAVVLLGLFFGLNIRKVK